MPVKLTRDVKHGCYRVSTPNGVKAKCTTKAKAEKQKRLLNAVDHGWKPTSESIDGLLENPAMLESILPAI